MYVYVTYICGAQKPKGVGATRTRVTEAVRCYVGESNPDSLEEKPEFLTAAESCLQSP